MGCAAGQFNVIASMATESIGSSMEQETILNPELLYSTMITELLRYVCAAPSTRQAYNLESNLEMWKATKVATMAAAVNTRATTIDDIVQEAAEESKRSPEAVRKAVRSYVGAKDIPPLKLAGPMSAPTQEGSFTTPGAYAMPIMCTIAHFVRVNAKLCVECGW